MNAIVSPGDDRGDGGKTDPAGKEPSGKKEPERLAPDELCERLAALYPFFFGDEARTTERVAIYHDALGFATGERLAIAYRRTMARWKYREPPMPAHFIEHLPPAEEKPKELTESRGEKEVEWLMKQLIPTPIGRSIVAQGFALGLRARITRRQVTEVADLTLDLIDTLAEERRQFDAAMDQAELIGSTLALGRAMRARQQRVNAEWRDYLMEMDANAV